MDFRTCPECRASVLEDDAADCPFCGASMSGKPSAAPKAKTEAAGTATASKSGATKTAKPNTTEDDADPFEVDTRAAVQAPSVARRPAKGRMIRVVCPMCETPGFIGKQHVGKEVKCCNPDCLVPVFTAPRPEAPKVEEPQPTRSLTTPIFAVIVLLLLGGGSFAVWKFVLNSPDDGAQGPGTINFQPGHLTDTDTDPQPEQDDPDPVVPEGPPPVPLNDVRAMVLADIVEQARDRANRSKPFARRLAAETFAQVGQLDEARAQIEAMKNVPAYAPFYEVEAWVAIARSEYLKGNPEAANTALDAAVAAADFPRVGRAPLDAAALLAAALAYMGRADEAVRIAESIDASGSQGRFSALWRTAIDSRTFDIDAAGERPYLKSMPNSVWVTSTRTIFAWAGPDDALGWAQTAPSLPVRDNCVAAWAGALVLTSPENVNARLDQVALTLQPAGRCRLWAAAAEAELSRGNRDAALANLAKATAELDTITAPSATLPMPDMRAIYDSQAQPRAGLPDGAALHAAALAAFDVAEVQVATGDTDAAWAAVDKALACTRGMTPSPVAAQAVRDECEGASRRNVESRLRDTFGLERNDVFLAFNRYRQQCGLLADASAARFALQVELLRRAVGLGLINEVWTLVQDRAQAEPAEAEPYLDSSLPGMIAVHAQHAGDSDLAKSIGNVPVDPLDQMEMPFDAAVAGGDYKTAGEIVARYISRERENPYPGRLRVLRAVSRLINERRHQDARELTLAMIDPLIREDALWLLAATSIPGGAHSDLWRAMPSLPLGPTETVALYRGFIDGMSVKEAAESNAAEDDDADSPTSADAE